MTSNIHVGSRNLLVKLKKCWRSRKFASQKLNNQNGESVWQFAKIIDAYI